MKELKGLSMDGWRIYAPEGCNADSPADRIQVWMRDVRGYPVFCQKALRDGMDLSCSAAAMAPHVISVRK